MRSMSKTPAEIVIEKFGGHLAIAAVLKIDVSRIYRWTYPQERGGTGGSIPSRHQMPLLDAAKEREIDLAPADFFPSDPAPASATERAA